MDNAARINMLARRAGMSYGQYQAMIFEQNGNVAAKRQEEPEAKPKKAGPKSNGRVCTICGKPIYGKVRGKVLTCGADCSYQLNLQRARERYRQTHQIREKFTKPCIYCGAEFKTWRDYQRFCSERCRDRYKAAVFRGVENPTAGKNSMATRTYGTAECEICGVSFTKRAPNQKCCSTECAAEKKWEARLAR